jgi:hypothetical protein
VNSQEPQFHVLVSYSGQACFQIECPIRLRQHALISYNVILIAKVSASGLLRITELNVDLRHLVWQSFLYLVT